jgi:hypothetical protein
MASDAAGQEVEHQSKAKVFISYSRKDMAFADRLETALKARAFEPLIDRNEIYAFEEWWKRIEALIVRADTVVFVLSPDSVASEIALKRPTVRGRAQPDLRKSAEIARFNSCLGTGRLRSHVDVSKDTVPAHQRPSLRGARAIYGRPMARRASSCGGRRPCTDETIALIWVPQVAFLGAADPAANRQGSTSQIR